MAPAFVPCGSVNVEERRRRGLPVCKERMRFDFGFGLRARAPIPYAIYFFAFFKKSTEG